MKKHTVADQQRVFIQARQLASLLTQYDQTQQTRRGYNHNALPLYLQAVHYWELDELSGNDPIGSLAKYFTTNPADDRDFCLAPVRKFVKSLSSPHP